MYLTAKMELGKYCNKELEGKDEKIRDLFPEMFKSDNLDSVSVEFETGYWRKANHIHKWFVDNCQDGEDECQISYVDREDLETLKVVCQKVLKFENGEKKKVQIKTGWANGKDTFAEIEVIADKENIEELLPTTSGCFFGGEEYDEYYFGDLKETIEIIDKCLNLPEYWSFRYRSSW